MHVQVRRGLAATTVVAAVLAVVTVASSPAVAADFYTPPSPLPAGRNGDVIKSEPSTYKGATATRVMYLSRDAKNKSIAVTGTVLVPAKPWPGPGPRPIVAYSPFTSGMGDQCAPSKALAGEGGDLVSQTHGLFINPLLERGIAVAQTDYQGLGTPGEHAYVIRASEAHTVLDVIRAAQRLPGTGLPATGPVGITGYSQGGGGSAAAVELAPEYAPELDVKGAYVGAPPADKAVFAKSLDGAYAFGFLGFSLVGINAAYPETRLVTLANEAGAELFVQASQACAMDAIFKFAFKQSSSLTKEGKPVSAYLTQEPFATVVKDLRIGNRKPTAPTLVEHTPADDIVPYGQGRQLAKDWCGLGANVQFRDILALPLMGHVFAAQPAAGNSAVWLGDRFAGKAATSNCGRF